MRDSSRGCCWYVATLCNMSVNAAVELMCLIRNPNNYPSTMKNGEWKKYWNFHVHSQTRAFSYVIEFFFSLRKSFVGCSTQTIFRWDFHSTFMACTMVYMCISQSWKRGKGRRDYENIHKTFPQFWFRKAKNCCKTNSSSFEHQIRNHSRGSNNKQHNSLHEQHLLFVHELYRVYDIFYCDYSTIMRTTSSHSHSHSTENLSHRLNLIP